MILTQTQFVPSIPAGHFKQFQTAPHHAEVQRNHEQAHPALA
jgi:hypothetical protein